MPVGETAAAAAMAWARTCTSRSASSALSTPAMAPAASSPTLCPAAASALRAIWPSPPNVASAAASAGRHQQRLGDRGIPDLVGVGCAAAAREITSGQARPMGQAVGDPGHVQPRGEKPGSLGTLPRRDDN